ncbi:unnamed protein product [Meganyctiphanes norvegica]|uniref:J domain-containing protein n=1 Tax=Meganyctiphanes norvegica TaxID=48144 RepID=A0AAV2RHE7_MEGNR
MDGLVISKRLWMSGFAWHRWMAIRRNHAINKKSKNHYETLGLNRDCTQEEVKAKYLELSHELHPDKNPGPDQHNCFVEVNEAYSVLHKANTRSVYDSQLKDLERGPRGGFTHEFGGIRTNAPRDRVVFHDDTIWETRDRSKDSQYANKPYYGVPGIKKKLSNTFIAGGAIVFMIIGSIIHFFIAKVSSDKARDFLNERDMMASRNYSIARDQAKLGNEQAKERLRKKVEAEKILYEERNKK